MTNFEKVGLFMKTFGQEVKVKASFSSDKINKLRVDLIEEELEELKEAINKKDLCILLNPSIGCFLIPKGEDNLAPLIGVFIKAF